MERENYDYLFKYIIIGNSNTGKSCFLHYFLENKYKKTTTHTIGVEFGSKILALGSKKIKLQIWDTAGQEKFRAVTKTYYRGALGAIILYDITSSETFSSIPQWLKDARELARQDISCILIGNKLDLKDNREIEMGDGAKFAQENGITFLEASALTGENVQDAFVLLSKMILNKIEGGLIDTTDVKPRLLGSLKPTPKENQSSRCNYCTK